jgi:hypothetical protein
MLSALVGIDADDDVSCNSFALALALPLFLAKAHTAAAAACANKKAIPAKAIPPAFKQAPPARSTSSSMNTVDVVLFPAFCLSNPNLSVICIVCTRSMSSLGITAFVDLNNDNVVTFGRFYFYYESDCTLCTYLFLRPYESTDLNSGAPSNLPHCTGSQAGIQGVTKALNCTTSDDGNETARSKKLHYIKMRYILAYLCNVSLCYLSGLCRFE